MTQPPNTLEDRTAEVALPVVYSDVAFRALADVTDDGVLVFTESGLYSKHSDSTDTVMCGLHLTGQALDRLAVQGAEELRVGVDFGRLRSYLHGASSDDELTLSYADGSVHGELRDQSLEFEVSEVEDPTAVPDYDFPSFETHCQVRGRQLKRTVQTFGKVLDESAAVEFSMSDDAEEYLTVRAKTETERLSKSFKKYRPPTPYKQEDPAIEDQMTTTTLKQLSGFAQIFGKSEQINVSFAEGEPVRFDMYLDETDNAQLMYSVAPKSDE
jgi:hypothetical protein